MLLRVLTTFFSRGYERRSYELFGHVTACADAIKASTDAKSSGSQGKITERAPNRFSLGKTWDVWKTYMYLSRRVLVGLDKLAVCKDTSHPIKARAADLWARCATKAAFNRRRSSSSHSYIAEANSPNSASPGEH